MRVLCCTAHGPEYQELADITRPSLERYCARWRYNLLYDPTRTDKDACKIALFEGAYRRGWDNPEDIFVWFDTDALVMNTERRIEAIVREHMPTGVHYLIGTDPNGLNSGVFIARFTPEAYTFMKVATSISVASGWADQEGVVQTAVKFPHKAIYKEVPGKVFNCNLYEIRGWDYAFGQYGYYINRYEEGDFVLHLAGTPEPQRSELLREYAAKAK